MPLGSQGQGVAHPAKAMDPLLGEYGFFTVFDGISEDEARARVRNMVLTYQMQEFQFYDAFRGYSQPPEPNEELWHSALFSRPIRRRILMAYADEIRRQGGRSWFYVQAAGTDPGDTALQNGFTKAGQHVVVGKPLLDIMVPNADWAKRVAPRWADFAASLGCTGVHWDTLGNIDGSLGPSSDFPGFLEAALPIVRQRGLEQMANFVDGAGWDPRLWTGPGHVRNIVAFPYWEVWTVPQVENQFFNDVVPSGGGVFVCYPGKSPDHEGEAQNTGVKGMWPFDLLIKRWVKARCHGNAYLAIGDGNKHIQTEYFPATSSICPKDKQKLLKSVFDGLVCPMTQTTTRTAERSSQDCFEVNTAYDPLDSLSASRRPLIRVNSPAECQERCRGMTGCQHFSFFGSFGHCHLEDAFAIKAAGRLGFTSGPPYCSTSSGSSFSEVLSQTELDCLEPGTEYVPSLGPIIDFGNDLSQRAAILECQARCASDGRCLHFTVSRGLNGNIHGLTCSLSGAGASRLRPFLQKISGPRSCEQDLTQRMFLVDPPSSGKDGSSNARAAVVSLFAATVLVAMLFYAMRVWHQKRPQQRQGHLALDTQWA